MANIIEIIDMLDWNKEPEIQSKGRELAKQISDIKPFLQPITQMHNKNVWDNCAIIISERCDEALKPYLVELLEWLQDMNWPGAFCIFDRIKKYTDKNSFYIAFNLCVEKAKENADEIWEYNLKKLIED